MKSALRRVMGPAAAAAVLAGCSDGTGPGGGQQITLSVVAGAGGAAAAQADSIALGGHTLVFDQVELVLKEIELERVFDACDDDGIARSSRSGSDDDDCEEFSTGPMLLDLPLGAGPDRVVTIQADSGTYREVEFKIHKPEDDDGDDRFLTQHPDLRRVSIRARGRYDGQPFGFVTDLTAEQEYDLVPPLVVGAGTATNLTLVVDIAGWFRVSGQLVNPMAALKGQPFESQVKENIKRSFDAFEDRDCDGHEDR